MSPATTRRPGRHPNPIGTVEIPIYADVDPVLTIGGIAAYFGVSKQLSDGWRERGDWPAPFAAPAAGAVYMTGDVIKWARGAGRAGLPDPIGTVEIPIYADVDPVLTIGEIAAYFGVSKQIANGWRKRRDWPAPFVEPAIGANVYQTADIIAWARVTRRPRGAGPRESGDTRPPKNG